MKHGHARAQKCVNTYVRVSRGKDFPLCRFPVSVALKFLEEVGCFHEEDAPCERRFGGSELAPTAVRGSGRAQSNAVESEWDRSSAAARPAQGI